MTAFDWANSCYLEACFKSLPLRVISVHIGGACRVQPPRHWGEAKEELGTGAILNGRGLDYFVLIA